MGQGILMFSIGPVQTFIAESRKLKDLYAGSFLLSHLIEEAVKELDRESNVEIIFPQLGFKSMPNRIVCTITFTDPIEMEQLAEKLIQSVKGTLEGIAEKLKKKHNITLQYFDDEIENLLEVYWVAKEIGDDPKGYEEDYHQLQVEMRRIKRLRAFEYREEPSGKNCSMSIGKRGVFTLELKEGSQKAKGLMEKGKALNREYETKIGRNEFLSSSAFLKRFLNDAEIKGYDDQFPSVCNVALGARLEKLGKVKLGEGKSGKNATDLDAVKEIILTNRSLTGNQADGLHKKIAGVSLKEEEYDEKDKKMIEKVYSIIEENKLSTTPYYAVVKFDGDSIGDLYNYPALRPTKTMKEFHIQLSKKIMGFAKELQEDLKPEDGVIVYAGGEDFLGFISLDALIPVMIQFRKKFDTIDLSDYIENKKLTFSAGITIAHYHENLADVMRDVGQAERYAKEIDEDKDALAIFLNIRGGETLKARIKFGVDCNNLDLIYGIVKKLKEKEVSNSFIYKLKQSIEKMKLDWTGSGAIPKEFVRLETIRILQASEGKKESFEPLLNDLSTLIEENSIDEYIKWLLICVFLQREVMKV